jgi:hypothetical protein
MFCFIVAVVCSGQMCVNPFTQSPCITTSDILNIQIGNATGNNYSGNYVIVSGYQQSCKECSKNTCADVCSNVSLLVEEGTTVTITQNNGSITFQSGSDIVDGSINADGTFKLGSIEPATDNVGETVGQTLVLFEGQFVGNNITANAAFHITANDPGLCDYQFVNVVTYKRTE